MPSLRLRTNLKCQSCLDKIGPKLNSHAEVRKWSVDLQAAEKWLTVEGEGLQEKDIIQWIQEAGFAAWSNLEDTNLPLHALTSPSLAKPKPASKTPWYATYRPVWLIAVYLLIGVAMMAWASGDWSLTRCMNRFMAGFFLVFSYFKFLDIRGFAKAFQGYDWLAQGWPPYGLIYPFLELGLGILFAAELFPLFTNLVAAALMGFGLLGVLSAIRKRQTIQCACLGTAFNLPMSTVTVIENTTMVLMSLWMLYHLWQA